MHLLYIDGSESVRNPNETYFILAGVAVFERQIYHIIKQTLRRGAAVRRFQNVAHHPTRGPCGVGYLAALRKHDTGYFDRIVSRFDSEGGVIHGLVHYKPSDEQCHCPACMSRSTPWKTSHDDP